MPRRAAFALLLLAFYAGASRAADPASFSLPTPPRLSLVDGQASFWRPDGPGVTPAQVNTPLAAGDTLATDPRATLEIQIGPQAYLRAGNATRLRLAAVAAEILRVELDAGVAALDIRALAPGQAIEVDTPHAAFTIDQPGYYRLGVDSRSASFIARRGGRALATSVGLGATLVESEREMRIDASGNGMMQAGPFDAWDRWNTERTDRLQASMSARYVAPGVYGVADLDRHGSWHNTGGYGPVWVPWATPDAWAPYSAGRWISDPLFGWTWIDDAPWGYAPFHHGRWVTLGATWAWAPGHHRARAEYAPALIAWTPGVRFGAAPGVGWVALGWGEPVAPWWGPRAFHGQPYWGGWGGPRVINRIVLHPTTVAQRVDLANIVYANAQQRNAVVIGRVDRHDAASHAPPDRALPLPAGASVRATPAPRFVPAEPRPVVANATPLTERQPLTERRGGEHADAQIARPQAARPVAMQMPVASQVPAAPQMPTAPQVPRAAMQQPQFQQPAMDAPARTGSIPAHAQPVPTQTPPMPILARSSPPQPRDFAHPSAALVPVQPAQPRPVDRPSERSSRGAQAALHHAPAMAPRVAAVTQHQQPPAAAPAGGAEQRRRQGASR